MQPKRWAYAPICRRRTKTGAICSKAEKDRAADIRYSSKSNTPQCGHHWLLRRCRGHRFLLNQIQTAAVEQGMASTVITFPVHPRCVMQPDFRAELLTTCDEKLALLDESGLDYCLLLDFTPELAALSARQFMELLIRRYNIRALFIGYDHRFGHAFLHHWVFREKPVKICVSARPASAACSMRVMWPVLPIT